MLAILRQKPALIIAANPSSLCYPTRYTLASWNLKNLVVQRALSEGPEKPLPFSKSKAASLSGNPFSSRGISDDTPWYQPLSISLSLGAILLWFCVLREENDLDQELSKSLYDRVDGLEKKQLELALKQSHPSSADTAAMQKRLDELDSSKIQDYDN